MGLPAPAARGPGRILSLGMLPNRASASRDQGRGAHWALTTYSSFPVEKSTPGEHTSQDETTDENLVASWQTREGDAAGALPLRRARRGLPVLVLRGRVAARLAGATPGAQAAARPLPR